MYRVPSLLLSQKDGEKLEESIRKGVAEYDDLELVRNSVVLDGSHQVITFEVKSDNVMNQALSGKVASLAGASYPLHTAMVGNIGTNLNAVSLGGNKESAGGKSEQLLSAIIGDIDIKMEGLAVELRRDIDLVTMLDEKLGESKLAILGDSEFRYTIHLPKAAKTSNAHEVLEGGKTLKWAYRLAAAHEIPMTLQVVAPIPFPILPWWFYVAVAVVVLVVLIILILILRRLLRRRR